MALPAIMRLRVRHSMMVALVVSTTILATLSAAGARRHVSTAPPDHGSAKPPSPPREIAPGSVGTSREVNRGIRRQLRGTRSGCDEGPPSKDSRAEWRRLSQPRALESLPLQAVAKESDHELVSEVYARVLDQLYTVGLGGMTRAEQNCYFIMSLEGEVMNGGFHQFFANSSGNCAQRTQAALKETAGFTEWATLFRRALDKFPAGRPAEDRAKRGDQMEAMRDEFAAWTDVEDLFYKLESSEQSLAAYIRGHIDSFARVVPRP
jgi:hypothetical protein